MGFLDGLLTRRIDTEIAWLKELRKSSEDWYNQLTQPLLPLLQGKIDVTAPGVAEKYKAIAEELLREAFIVNAGDEVNNLFQEMGKRGLPFFTSRAALTPLIAEYLEAGLFLKRIVYGFDPDRARDKWKHFQISKDALVTEINGQLRRIG